MTICNPMAGIFSFTSASSLRIAMYIQMLISSHTLEWIWTWLPSLASREFYKGLCAVIHWDKTYQKCMK